MPSEQTTPCAMCDQAGACTDLCRGTGEGRDASAPTAWTPQLMRTGCNMDDVQKTTDLGNAGDEEIGALHCLGMCMDWEGHPAYQSEHDAGLRQFLIDCAEGLRWQRDEIERLRQALAEIAFQPDVVPYKPGAISVRIATRS